MLRFGKAGNARLPSNVTICSCNKGHAFGVYARRVIRGARRRSLRSSGLLFCSRRAIILLCAVSVVATVARGVESFRHVEQDGKNVDP